MEDIEIMGFRQFCKRIATENTIEITIPDDPMTVGIPFNLESPIQVLTNTLKPLKKRFDSISVPYVEKCFSDMEKVFKVMDEEYDNDVDDGIPYALSMYLYDTQFNELSADDQAIIKVLTVYLLVQNKSKSNKEE
jgi:hypothetical protein